MNKDARLTPYSCPEAAAPHMSATSDAAGSAARRALW